VLEGRHAEIKWDSEESIEFKEISKLTEEDKNKLQSFVQALANLS